MKRFYIPVLLCLFFLLSISAVHAEEDYTGHIISATYSPTEPYISQQISFNLVIINDGNKANDYALRILITKEGKIENQQDITFHLDPGQTFSVNPSYSPVEIGNHEVVIRLRDSAGIDLYDSKVLKFTIFSEIGPFDLSVDPISKVVKPGETLPIIVKMLNMGTKNGDVLIRVTVDCHGTQPNIIQEFLIYLKSGETEEKSLSVPVCFTQGLHDLSSSLIIYNTTWATVTNQFFVNKSISELSLVVPDEVKVRAGSMDSLAVTVRNPTNVEATNVQMSVENLPPSWYNITPSTISFLSGNEAAVFLITIEPPINATQKTYSIKLSVGGDNVLSRADSNLVVLAGSSAENQPIKIDFASILTNPITIILIFALAAVAIGSIFFIKRRRQEAIQREEILEKIKK